MSSSGEVDGFEHLDGASNFGASDSEYSFTSSNNTGTQAASARSNSSNVDINSSNLSLDSQANHSVNKKSNLDLDLDLDDLSLTDADIEAGLNLNSTSNKATAVDSQLSNRHGHHHHQDGEDLFDEELEKGGAQQSQPLPPHSCAYCGIHNPSCVVKCLVCNKWSVLLLYLIITSCFFWANGNVLVYLLAGSAIPEDPLLVLTLSLIWSEQSIRKSLFMLNPLWARLLRNVTIVGQRTSSCWASSLQRARLWSFSFVGE